MVSDRDRGRLHEVLAANLRRLRIARHLSLSELARGTGMSKATLSSIENARANPTVDTLAALAGALRVSLVELLEELPLGEVTVVRATRSKFQTHDGIPQRLLGTAAARAQLSELSLPARKLVEVEAKPPGTRTHLYVVAGRLISGPVERITELDVGDYLAFPADVAHTYETGRQRARALLLSEAAG